MRIKVTANLTASSIRRSVAGEEERPGGEAGNTRQGSRTKTKIWGWKEKEDRGKKEVGRRKMRVKGREKKQVYE